MSTVRPLSKGFVLVFLWWAHNVTTNMSALKTFGRNDDVGTELTIAMVRFVQPSCANTWPIHWCMVPEPRKLTVPELFEKLSGLAKPVVAAALAHPGMIAIWSIPDDATDHAKMLRYTHQNQRSFLTEKLEALGVRSAEERILVEYAEYSRVITVATVQDWAQNYLVIGSGWTLERYEGDQRASVCLSLRHPDGSWSPSPTCPVPTTPNV